MAAGDRIGIALEATSQEILENVGHTADIGGTATSGTIFAKENAMIVMLNSVYDELKNGITAHIVRHIQRGTFDIEKDSSSATISLTGFADSNKMIVWIDGVAQGNVSSGTSTSSSGTLGGCLYLSSLSTTSCTIKSPVRSSSLRGSYGSYQIIEFY